MFKRGNYKYPHQLLAKAAKQREKELAENAALAFRTGGARSQREELKQEAKLRLQDVGAPPIPPTAAPVSGPRDEPTL